MGLEVIVEDVDDLVDKHSEDRTIKKLQDIHLKVQQTTDEKEVTRENVHFSEIKGVF